MDGTVSRLASKLQTTLSTNAYPRALNLGSGMRPAAGFLNVDVSDLVGADLVLNLDSRPWKLPENYFTSVRIHDVVEHLKDVRATFAEIHRVSQNGARVDISVPHFSSANAFADPDHLHFFAHNSLNFCTEASNRHLYKIESVRVHFEPYLGSRLAQYLANRNLAAYEKRWVWMFPAGFLSYQLTVVK